MTNRTDLKAITVNVDSIALIAQGTMLVATGQAQYGTGQVQDFAARIFDDARLIDLFSSATGTPTYMSNDCTGRFTGWASTAVAIAMFDRIEDAVRNAAPAHNGDVS